MVSITWPRNHHMLPRNPHVGSPNNNTRQGREETQTGVQIELNGVAFMGMATMNQNFKGKSRVLHVQEPKPLRKECKIEREKKPKTDFSSRANQEEQWWAAGFVGFQQRVNWKWQVPQAKIHSKRLRTTSDGVVQKKMQ
ncbi:hypothetical protein AMTR_s00226p00020420 [Amborella trichopoda]|uniref:Uncharacterized protein n=1 Tax=Amborella trichopoda TaxID=13333 RepID=W1NUG8_AMBTC|nr:hypothetical protein AMTR_s00226p00020420 [Amborella trichopoda]